jgi:hypothetical protein
MECRVRVNGVGLNFHFDLRSFLQLHFVPLRVGQDIGYPNFAIKVVRTLDGDLRFFGFAGSGMRGNHFLNSSWERCAGLGFLGRHD